MMKSDIQIAQEASMQSIDCVFNKLFPTGNISSNGNIEMYGKYMGKIPLELMKSYADYVNKHLILVTSISPTKSGIGKKYRNCNDR